MANKLIEEVSFTPEKKEQILTYAQLAMALKQGIATMTNEDVMLSIRKALNMTHGEIIAVAQTLAK